MNEFQVLLFVNWAAGALFGVSVSYLVRRWLFWARVQRFADEEYRS